MIELISSIMDPAINYTLLKLGIVKDVKTNDNTAETAFVFTGIPIGSNSGFNF